jgi:hypothetical protein
VNVDRALWLVILTIVLAMLLATVVVDWWRNRS